MRLRNWCVDVLPAALVLSFALRADGQASAVSRPIAVDLSRFKDGPIKVERHNDSLDVVWTDSRNRDWKATFSLDSTKPLIKAISSGGKSVIEGARPVYSATAGKRRGGWDAFFDFPPSHPDGTRSFLG